MATSELGAGAVRHIVMLKVKDKEARAAAKAGLQKIGDDGLEGVTFLSFKINEDLGLVETNYDLVLIIDFPDKENYLAYNRHPGHVSVITANKHNVLARASLQFSLNPKL